MAHGVSRTPQVWIPASENFFTCSTYSGGVWSGPSPSMVVGRVTVMNTPSVGGLSKMNCWALASHSSHSG